MQLEARRGGGHTMCWVQGLWSVNAWTSQLVCAEDGACALIAHALMFNIYYFICIFIKSKLTVELILEFFLMYVSSLMLC